MVAGRPRLCWLILRHALTQCLKLAHAHASCAGADVSLTAVGQWGGWSTGIPGPQWYEPSLGTDHWAGVEWNELWVACSDAGVSDTCLPVQPRADECDPASAEPPAPANPDW